MGLFRRKKKTNQQIDYTPFLNAYNAALTAAQQRSPEEQLLSDQATGVLNWAKAGDYRQAPRGVFFNRMPVAQRQRQREMISNAASLGTSALGQPNANLLALDKANRDAEFDRDQAAQYEGDVANAVAGATGMAGNLAQADQNRRMGILGQTGNMFSTIYQTNNQPQQKKTPWWQSLLSGGLSALAAI